MNAAGIESSTPWEQLRSAINALAASLDPQRIGAGPLAELRRTDPAAPPPVFWRLLLEHVPESLRRHESELAWALIIGGMARLAGGGRRPHAQDAKLGIVLARTRYAEPRLVRLLRAEGPGLANEVRSVCLWLDTQGEAADWVQLAQFVLSRAGRQPTFDAGQATRDIARDYFREVLRQSRDKASDTIEESHV